MSTDILMPALSPTMEAGILAKWFIKAGDMVRSGDVIAEIETDKATMEVEAVDEGLVEEILIPEGTEDVKVNTPIARLAGGEPGLAIPSAGQVPEPAANPSVAEMPEPKPVLAAPVHSAREARVFASPLARRIAGQKGLDISAIKGSGPHGRIIKADVDRAVPGGTPASDRRPTAPAGVVSVSSQPRQVQSLSQMGIKDGTYDLIPLDGMRKTVARRMSDSFRDVPHFPLTIDLNIDALLTARLKINGLLEAQGQKVSVNDLVIKAAAIALKQVPEANASYTPDGIAMHHHADIAMAVAIDGGLITPIIRSAEMKGLAQIAAEARDLASRARAKKLRPEEFQGGTFSISNLGMFGIKAFASIINEPQGAILSVGAGEKRAVVVADQLAMATVMTVTLTCDHRVVDGAVGARWLQAFKGLIEDPITMIV